MKDLRRNRWGRQQRKRQEAEFWRRSWVDMVQEINVNPPKKYIIPNQQSNAERELNMQANMKIKNGKNLKVKTLVDSGYIYMGIDKQLVKNKRIQTKPINFSFKVFNMDGTKNREVTKVVPLEIEINRYKE